MTRVQLNKLEKMLYIIAAVFALAVIILIVGASVVPTDATGVKQKIDAGFYGYDIVFGLKDGDVYGLRFSFMALLPYIFTLAGMVLLVFRILDKYVSRKYDFLIAGIFLVAALLYFLSNNFLVFTNNLVGELFGSFKYQIAYGTIVSGILSVLSGGLAAASYVVEEFVTTVENNSEQTKAEAKTELKEETVKTETQKVKETKKKAKKETKETEEIPEEKAETEKETSAE